MKLSAYSHRRSNCTANVSFRIRCLNTTGFLACVLFAWCAGSSQLTAQTTRIMDRLTVDLIWPGHPVGFKILTDEARGRQYVAYYDFDRNMAVASRDLYSREWTKQILPTRVGWDSHNYVTMALDRDGNLHVSGNMHCSPLIYFRTEKPGDITTLRQIPRMTGKREMQVTYPQFVEAPDGQMIFTYRDGQSGKGDTLYNRYDEKTQQWTSLLSQPLFDGQGEMNAYPIGPIRGPDGYWHITWVWRDTPDASSNHDLSYARSKDLVTWETMDGRPAPLPISLKTPGSILDPIPAGGAIINGSGRIGFDKQGRVVIAYHKYDEKGATQIYFAREENRQWKIRQLTDWTYRWVPGGGGTISFDVNHGELMNDPVLGLYIGINNKMHESGTWRVDPETLLLLDKIPSNQLPNYIPSEISQRMGGDERLIVRAPSERSKLRPERRYVLRWEALPFNRDRPHNPPPPATSRLEVFTIVTTPAK